MAINYTVLLFKGYWGHPMLRDGGNSLDVPQHAGYEDNQTTNDYLNMRFLLIQPLFVNRAHRCKLSSPMVAVSFYSNEPSLDGV
ncbi:MAG: hypothetical protein M3R08_10940 [Bacteroidota bacterium]|nr:hypothetical protein [Bacteroidota bacterium]